MKIEIRSEEEKDYRAVEEITREAFWNLYIPGCNEHLLVNKLRKHPDFIPELDFVAITDKKIVGNIMYSKAKIIDNNNVEHEVILFGPLTVLPEFQRQEIGKTLVEVSKTVAKNLGYKAILIYGFPNYYHKLGFKSASIFNISRADGLYAPALMALELYDGALKGIEGRLIESSIFSELNDDELELFDKSFPIKEKKITQSQKEFEIMASLTE